MACYRRLKQYFWGEYTYVFFTYPEFRWEFLKSCQYQSPALHHLPNAAKEIDSEDEDMLITVDAINPNDYEIMDEFYDSDNCEDRRKDRNTYFKKCNHIVSKFNRYEAVHGERPKWNDGMTSREDMEEYLWLHRIMHENDGYEAKSALGRARFDLFYRESYKRTQLHEVLPLWVESLGSPPPPA